MGVDRFVEGADEQHAGVLEGIQRGGNWKVHRRTPSKKNGS
jgi:hypothetical protein